MLEEMIRQQQELLGVDTVQCSVGLLGGASDSLQHHGKGLSAASTCTAEPQSPRLGGAT